MSYLFDTIIDCYMGDYVKCILHSFVCTWDEASSCPYISTVLDLASVNQIITPTPKNRNKLKRFMNIRLSRRTVSMTFKKTKFEAVKRGIMKAIPNHITFKRNYARRVVQCSFLNLQLIMPLQIEVFPTYTYFHGIIVSHFTRKCTSY